MAGENIYIGKMIAGLQDKIDTMTTSTAAQVSKMDEQIVALQDINSAVGQSAVLEDTMVSAINSQITELQTVASLISMGIAEVNVIPSELNKIYINEITEQMVISINTLLLLTLKSFASGSIKFAGAVRCGTIGYGGAAKMNVLVNDVTKYTITSTVRGATVTGTSNISVAKGDVVKVTIAATDVSGIEAYAPAGQSYIGYDYLSISQSGAIVIV